MALLKIKPGKEVLHGPSPLTGKERKAWPAFPWIGSGNGGIVNIFTDEQGLFCKPGQLQMVERRNTAGSIFQIMTVIKLPEH